MQVIDILALIMWFIVGIMNLCSNKPISKISYGLTWGALMMYTFVIALM